MTAKEAAWKWCELYSSHGDFEESGQQEAFHAGFNAARDQILALLRSPEAVMAIGFPHALEVATDWLEKTLKEGDV